MKSNSTNRIAAVLLWVLITSLSIIAQPKGQPNQPSLSPDEQKMASNIVAAPDLAAKLKAAGEFIKKYPKSSIRSQVLGNLASQVEKVTDNAQKLTLAQELQTIFTEPAEAEEVGRVVVQAYADANQPDQAFAKGAEFLTRAPDALELLVQLVAIGTDQVKKQNPKFTPQTMQYTKHAIELFEGNKKPAGIDDARWANYKGDTLPGLYQALGLLYFSQGDSATAKTQYMKASQLKPTDPFNFIMLAAMLNQDYQDEAKRYQSMPAGPPRDEQLKKVQALLDSVIDAYAHSVALSEGVATLQQIREQYLSDLASYYKYRHGGSTEGMQQLIDKYKPVKP
jgi:tetratricopeptide (TPR) repeat protein